MSSDDDATREAGNSRDLSGTSTRGGAETATGEGTPQRHTPVTSVPLPPRLPIGENRETLLSTSAHAPAALATGGLHGPGEADAQPSVEPDHWVQEPDFWEKETMIAMTGRYPVPRPKTRPLPPPQRFRPVARWKSMLLMGTFVVVTILACAGAIELGKLGAEVLGTQATPVVTHTAQPAVSPTVGAHK